MNSTAASGRSRKRVDFSGTWVLDKVRSQSSAPHLEAMGLPDMAQIAANQVDPVYIISQDAGSGAVRISHSSILGERERLLEVGVDWRETMKDGSAVKMSIEYPSPLVLRIVTDWAGRGRILDTRTLLEEGAVIQQEVDFLHAAPKGVEKRTTTRRFFNRSEATAAAAPTGPIAAAAASSTTINFVSAAAAAHPSAAAAAAPSFGVFF